MEKSVLPECQWAVLMQCNEKKKKKVEGLSPNKNYVKFPTTGKNLCYGTMVVMAAVAKCNVCSAF